VILSSHSIDDRAFCVIFGELFSHLCRFFSLFQVILRLLLPVSLNVGLKILYICQIFGNFPPDTLFYSQVNNSL
jgi:hypothetical protein